MNKKRVLVRFVLDETGSMMSQRTAAIDGFNDYVGELRGNENATVHLTLTKFNSVGINTVYANMPVDKVPNLNEEVYCPNSGTPLYDAIGLEIGKIEWSLQEYKKAHKKLPSVLVVILTDGEENSSREYTRE